MEFKKYAIEEFNAEYGTSINDNLNISEIVENLYSHDVDVQFIGMKEDVISDYEDFLDEIGHTCEMVGVAGFYMAIL